MRWVSPSEPRPQPTRLERVAAAAAWCDHGRLMSDDNPPDNAVPDNAVPDNTVPDDAVLAGYRGRIDELDAELLRLLAERFDITKAVGAFKARTGLPPADPAREQQQVARLRRIAEEVGMDPAFSEKVFRLIVDEVIRHHERIADALNGS
jgi:chorismate mutase